MFSSIDTHHQLSPNHFEARQQPTADGQNVRVLESQGSCAPPTPVLLPIPPKSNETYHRCPVYVLLPKNREQAGCEEGSGSDGSSALPFLSISMVTNKVGGILQISALY